MDISQIIDKAVKRENLNLDEVTALMAASKKEDLDIIFSAARKVRDVQFGKKVFIYGFVYFSTYCRNNCAFCYYRATNTELGRYRKTPEEIMALSTSLYDAGINLVDLTMGEDPMMYANGHKELLNIVQGVRDEVPIGIMVSPGAMPREMFPKMKEAGADWFACYQETYNRDLFAKLRLDQDYDYRLNQRVWAREAGILTEDGMLVGLGETARDRAEATLRMGALGCEQIRAMTFVPQHGTPMQAIVPADSMDELKVIATMRLLFPDRLIPASLDVEGIVGLKTRIDAGANVITSIIPPHMELAGVAQHDLNIDDGCRSVDYVKEMLDDMGRHVATNAEYGAFLSEHKALIKGAE
ncbi:MAG: methylornithine synthase PylB [Candidatus Methanomethylophilaceae archaeon]|nr:methylornithine synthase PylB [Candidatus Methanomethylophilaceae archaeon]